MSAQEEREPLEVKVEVVDAAVPLEERLRSALVVAGLGAGVVALLLLVAAFGLAVAARWQPDAGRALDGTAVLAVLAAAVAGVLAVLAVRYGIGTADDVEPAAQVDEEVER